MNDLTILGKRSGPSFRAKYIVFTPRVDAVPETEELLKVLKVEKTVFNFYGVGYHGVPFYYQDRDDCFCYYDPAWPDHFDEEAYDERSDASDTLFTQ